MLIIYRNEREIHSGSSQHGVSLLITNWRETSHLQVTNPVEVSLWIRCQDELQRQSVSKDLFRIRLVGRIQDPPNPSSGALLHRHMQEEEETWVVVGWC